MIQFCKGVCSHLGAKDFKTGVGRRAALSKYYEKVGPKMKKCFENYAPKVSTSDMRKVIQIRRARIDCLQKYRSRERTQSQTKIFSLLGKDGETRRLWLSWKEVWF